VSLMSHRATYLSVRGDLRPYTVPMPAEKATIAEIRQRFDTDVERFSNLETGQTSTVDAALALELVATAAARVTPHATRLLDVGCGAGNYTLRLLQELPG